MARAKTEKTRGDELAEQLFQAIREGKNAPLPGARNLAVLHGITRDGDYLWPQENVLVDAAKILLESRQVFRFGDSVVLEFGAADNVDKFLVPVCNSWEVEKSARSLLANIFVCEIESEDHATQFPPPKWFIEVALNATTTRARLPRILHHARRPVLSYDFELLDPGWHEESGTLVHGRAVEPIMSGAADTRKPALERLPTHLRNLLSGVCFRSDADLANTVAMMLTGLLSNHFATEPKAIFPVDGNQPELGKTWLLRAVGVVLDGVDPRLIAFTDSEEEIYKRICANVREMRQSLLVIDNAKSSVGKEIKSPVIECMSVAPELSLRILQTSTNFNRPNDLIWAFTMNNSRFGKDLISRSCSIRLYYEGQPKNHFSGRRNPIRYAYEHRLEILGELVGMVLAWNQAGRPPGGKKHRCELWAEIIGAILAHAGFPEFLDNADEVAASFSTELEELTALGEAVVKANGPYLERGSVTTPATQELKQLPAKDWLRYFTSVGILIEELGECKSEHGKAIKLGQFLGPKVDSEVPIQVAERIGKATLRSKPGRAKAKLYFFEVDWDSSLADHGETPKDQSANSASRQEAESVTASATIPNTQSKTETRNRPHAVSSSHKEHETHTTTTATKTANGNSEAWG